MKTVKDFFEVFINFSHHRTNDWTMNSTHFHNHYEINLSVSGGNRFIINEKIYDAKPGSLFILSDKDLHRNCVPKGYDYERYMVSFSANSIPTFIHDDHHLLELFTTDRNTFDHCLLLSSAEQLTIIELFNDVIRAQNQQRNNLKTYKQIKLSELLYKLLHIYQKRYTTSETIKKEPSWTTHNIIDYINSHIHEPITLSELSDRFYLNRTYLCDKFKKDTGMTINQYITRRRILKARDLLKTDMSVTEVALAVGYSDASHFIRNFKKLVGITPKQYTLNPNA